VIDINRGRISRRDDLEAMHGFWSATLDRLTQYVDGGGETRGCAGDHLSPPKPPIDEAPRKK
jgi:hypothetical protein